EHELSERLGYELAEVKPYTFDDNGDRYGCDKGINGKWNVTFFIQDGRVKDEEDYPMMTGLREIAKVHEGDFRLTANQNLIIANVPEDQKEKIEALITLYGLTNG